MPAWRKAADLAKSYAKRPLAYLKGATQGRDVQCFVYMRESQPLCLFDKITVRVALPAERRFSHYFEPLTSVHRYPPVESARQIWFTGHTHHDGVLVRYCPLRQSQDFGGAVGRAE
jgi:hypothetical protein